MERIMVVDDRLNLLGRLDVNDQNGDGVYVNVRGSAGTKFIRFCTVSNADGTEGRVLSSGGLTADDLKKVHGFWPVA